jgi:hypothetical protein
MRTTPNAIPEMTQSFSIFLTIIFLFFITLLASPQVFADDTTEAPTLFSPIAEERIFLECFDFFS